MRVETHARRFDADNALSLAENYQVLVDCSDNFRTKFLVNDAAVLARKAAVFASVYQYEGQLQVYKPAAAHACLRCLWPEATADGIVGNCAEAGVLGPVAGALGALQAILVIKVLLDMDGQLGGELMLLDLMNFTSLKLKAARRPECRAPDCAHVRAPAAEARDLEIALGSLEESRARGLEPVDIRSAAEIAEWPSGARHIPMAELLAEPGLLVPSATYLLVCASGTRSLAAARELARRGLSVRSLRGGLRALSPRNS